MIILKKEISSKQIARVLISVLFLLGAIVVSGTCGEKEAVTVSRKEISGEVSAVTSKFISIVYQRDETKGEEFEMPFDLDKSVRLRHIKRLSDIQPGDTVKIIFDESNKSVTETGRDGNPETKTRTLERKPKEVVFIKPKAQGLATGSDLQIKGLRGE